jgi:hypothetical protein
MKEESRRKDWDTNCLAELEGALADKAKLYELFRVGMAWGGSNFRIAREDFQPDNHRFWPISDNYQSFFENYPKTLKDTIANLTVLTANEELSDASRDAMGFDLALQEQTLTRVEKAKAQIGLEARDWLADSNRSVAYGVSLTRTNNWTPQEITRLRQIDPTEKDVTAIGIVAETLVKKRLEAAISQLPPEEHAVVDRQQRNHLLASMEDLMPLPKARALDAVVARMREFEDSLAETNGADMTVIHPMRNGDFHVSYDSSETRPMEEADHRTIKAFYAEESAAKHEAEIERRGSLQKFNQEIDAGQYNQFLPFKVASADASLSLEDKARLKALPGLQTSANKSGLGPITPEAQAEGRIVRPVENSIPIVHLNGSLFDMETLGKKPGSSDGH